MINIQFITVEGCYHCAKVKEIFEDLKPQYRKRKFEKIDATTDAGMELVSKYGIFQIVGILIYGNLFSTVGLKKE